jgi:RHS repeat-associated protein
LEDDTPLTVAEVAYDYDLDGNLTERDVTLPGNADAGLNEYGYDNMGRLLSWTLDTTTVDYEWDDAGNRVGVDADAFVYDQRNRLVSGPDGDYEYSPRGTLSEFDDGLAAVSYSFDPLGRLTAVDTVDYSYDGLGRVADREGVDFSYQGFSLDPVSDGSFSYSRTPGGRLVGISDGVDDLLVGLDRHGDLTHLFQAEGTITDTALYDPFGDPLASTGGFDPVVGFQGDWTDPASGHVWMGARWYEGSWAAFLSRDTIFGELSTPISLKPVHLRLRQPPRLLGSRRADQYRSGQLLRQLQHPTPTRGGTTRRHRRLHGTTVDHSPSGHHHRHRSSRPKH